MLGDVDAPIRTPDVLKSVPPAIIERSIAAVEDQNVVAQIRTESMAAAKLGAPEATVQNMHNTVQAVTTVAEATAVAQMTRSVVAPVPRASVEPILESVATPSQAVRSEVVSLFTENGIVQYLENESSEEVTQPSTEVLLSYVPNAENIVATYEEQVAEVDVGDIDVVGSVETATSTEAEVFEPLPLLSGYVIVNFESVDPASYDEQEPIPIFAITPEVSPAEVVEGLASHLEALRVAELVEASSMVSRIHVLQERLLIITEATNPIEYQKISEVIEATGIELMQLLRIDCEPSLEKQFVQMLIECIQSGDHALLDEVAYIDEGTHEIKDFGRLLNLLKDAARNMQAKLQHYMVLGKSALLQSVPALT